MKKKVSIWNDVFEQKKTGIFPTIVTIFILLVMRSLWSLLKTLYNSLKLELDEKIMYKVIKLLKYKKSAIKFLKNLKQIIITLYTVKKSEKKILNTLKIFFCRRKTVVLVHTCSTRFLNELKNKLAHYFAFLV